MLWQALTDSLMLFFCVFKKGKAVFCSFSVMCIRIGITINATQCRQSVQHEYMLGLMVERLMLCVKKLQNV